MALERRCANNNKSTSLWARPLLALSVGLSLLFTPLLFAIPATSSPERLLIEEFKSSERGPFGNIRWFCNNGQIIVPRAGNCNSRGDGVQHGEYLSSTKALRNQGFPIATIFADIDQEKANTLVSEFDKIPGIVLERYLLSRDDGWIFRKAGAFYPK